MARKKAQKEKPEQAFDSFEEEVGKKRRRRRKGEEETPSQEVFWEEARAERPRFWPLIQAHRSLRYALALLGLILLLVLDIALSLNEVDRFCLLLGAEILLALLGFWYWHVLRAQGRGES